VKKSVVVSAANVVHPPADPPRIAIRAPSASPLSISACAAATQSSTSTMPHCPSSSLR
jgi:hypothetical protein